MKEKELTQKISNRHTFSEGKGNVNQNDFQCKSSAANAVCVKGDQQRMALEIMTTLEMNKQENKSPPDAKIKFQAQCVCCVFL